MKNIRKNCRSNSTQYSSFQENSHDKERIHIMRYVDDTSDTLTEELWQEVVPQRSAEPAALARSASCVGRFFNSLAASMALLQRRSRGHAGENRIMYPSEILAQNYPYLYIQSM
jgi:hypothetical protein